MKIKIKNSEELKKELLRLTLLKKEQEAYLAQQYTLLKNKVETPARVFNAVVSNVPGVGMIKGLFSTSASGGGKTSASNKSDWLTKASQIVLPLVLNRTLLKKSGWLKKTLVLLASEGAASQINKDKISSVVNKVAEFIRPKKSSKKKHKNIKPLEEEPEDSNLGIPPLSETY